MVSFSHHIIILYHKESKNIHKYELTDGSRDIIRTVLSLNPTAKKQALCSPGLTDPNAIQDTSEDNFLRSVYSFNWPVYKKKKKKHGN